MSGVYIKDLEMPKTCGECLLYHLRPSGESYCAYNLFTVCPFIEVKSPHGDLIDRDLWRKIGALDGVPYKGACKRVLIQAKTVIPADYGEENNEE